MPNSEIAFDLDIHPYLGFYQINENGMKCEFMELEGYNMLCNRDIGVFKKGETYLIHSNSNDDIIFDNDQARELALKSGRKLSDLDLEYGFYEFIPVERFEDRTFTLIEVLD
ncbi:hypothetical protein JUJ52_19360 [Virgibacillus sp. AGTR]|uniref:hypothetical protein n=1 Tax=Virgibacillus sp. AGTR TaxID=2812055 RepID=UPI001D16EE89|nr:hypothetical protein [Virgibacillus sp. AGTR]MCC2252092.1 hypothetical protein [Virgibacillus sp. AGTR]